MRAECDPSQCRRAASLPVLAVVIWGVTWPVMSIGLDHVPPIFLGALRMFAGAAFMFVLAAASARFIVPARRGWGIVVSAGLPRMAIPTALMHFSLSFVDAGRASLFAFTHPVWIAPAAVFLLHEPLNRGAAGGLVLGTGGLPVLFNPFGSGWSDPDTVIGNAIPRIGRQKQTLRAVVRTKILHRSSHEERQDTQEKYTENPTDC